MRIAGEVLRAMAVKNGDNRLYDLAMRNHAHAAIPRLTGCKQRRGCSGGGSGQRLAVRRRHVRIAGVDRIEQPSLRVVERG